MTICRNTEMSKRQHHAPRHIQAVIAAGSHLFPSRTEKLSPLAPMVLHTRGRVGSRHFYEKPRAQQCVRGFLIVFAASGVCTCCLGESANVASGSLQMQARKPASLGCPPSFPASLLVILRVSLGLSQKHMKTYKNIVFSVHFQF